MSDARQVACLHVRNGLMEATATATLALDTDGPVKHALQPVHMRLCPLCAGMVSATLHQLEVGRR